MLAGAAFVAVPANAAVTVGGFTLDTGTFGAQTGVHSTGTQLPNTTLTGYVNQEGSGVIFSTTTGLISITGSGEATVDGDPSIEDLMVAFEHGWDNVTFSFFGDTGSFDLLVNGASLFDGGGNCSALCLIGNGANQFTLSGSGITSLAFTFDPGIDNAKQFRVTLPGVAVPEPAAWAMMILGLGAIGASMRRRHKTSVTYSIA